MSQKRVDTKTKNRAIAEYQTTGNASAVARKYGVARSTFLAWIGEIAHIKPSTPAVEKASIRAIEATSKAAVRSIEHSMATREEFLQQHYAEVGEAFSLILQGIKESLSRPQPLRDQAAALTALANFVEKFTPAEEQKAVQINLLQQTVNQ